MIPGDLSHENNTLAVSRLCKWSYGYLLVWCSVAAPYCAQNDAQELIELPIVPPSENSQTEAEQESQVGMYAQDEVLAGLEAAYTALENDNPDKVITLGGNCMDSQAPFDYLHGKYPNTGVIWIDAHPDVSTVANGYPNAHALVLAALLGHEETVLSPRLHNKPFAAEDVLYVGLQPLHGYQADFLEQHGVAH